MSSNTPRTKGLSSHFINLKIWRFSILTTTILVVAVAAGYVATGATPGIIRSVSRTVRGIFEPQVHASSARPTFAEPVIVQDPVPTVVTDKTGYLGGEAVAISGAAFGSSEAVTLRITLADGSAVSDAFGATATAEGTFEAAWSMPNTSAGHGFVVTAVGNTSGASSSSTFSRIAIVETDKYDYQPGETATFTGAGFYANEVVTLQVVHSNGNNFGSGHEPFEATADADGKLTATWFVHPDDSESSIFRLTATGKTSGLTTTTTFTDVIISFIDDAGPDDEPGQKDLNAMSSDLGATAVGITWNWDDTGFGPLGGNTGDACTLVDTDADGFANFAFCVTVDGNPAVKVANRFYSCNDTRSDRCGGPTLIPAFTTTSTASVVANSDPFAAHPDHNDGNDCDVDANCLTHDTVANVTLELSDVGGGTARLLNVCSFPSEEPNSDPSDCVIHPDRGFLTIRKTTQTTENTTTGFTFNTSAPSAGGVSSFSANVTGAQTNFVVANQILFAAGTYNLSEVVPAGWDLTTASCTIQSGNPTSTGTFAGSTITGLTIQTGLETICTFTNVRRGKIIVKKETDPDGDTQSFSFTASYDNDGFSLTDGQQNDSGFIAPGTHSVSENTPAGWDLESATCDDGSAPNNISLQAGEIVTCTFTNEKDAKIVVVKQTDPDGDTQSFDFTASYDNDGFSLTDGQQNDSGDLDPGTYSVSETVPTGWDLTSSPCVSSKGDSETIGNISLQAGETVTCTFNNQKDAKIIVIKQTDPDGDTQSFDFTSSYDNDGFSLTDNQQNDSGDLDPGTYSVSETVPAGWDLTSSPCVSSKGDSETIGNISLQAGETVTCTFNNQKDANIVVIKQTDPDGDTQSFSFTASYDNDGFSLTDGQQNDSGDLDPGTYSVSETVPAGWDLTSSPCISSKGDSETIGNISLQAGETVTCTFNNQKDAKIVVIKQTDPDGDTQSFDFTASYDNDGFSLTDGQQNDSGDLDPGTYSVSETVPAGWDLTSSPCVSSKGDSETAGSISLQAGETVTCTFNNQKDANIVVIKQTDPDGDTQSFDFTASYDNDGFSLTDGQQNDSGDIDPGSYSVSETVPAGWDLTSSPCVSSKGDSETAGNISLQAGETVTCTFNNQKDAKIVVVKQTDPDGDTQSFDFTASYDNDGFSLTDNQQNDSGDLDPGTYSVSETVPAGWDLTSSPCVSSKGDSETIGNISLQAGETVTCTFNNQKDANIVVIKQTDPDGDTQSFDFTASYDNDGFSLTDGQQNNSGDLDPGPYSVSETVPTGWDLTSSPCVSSKGDNETAGNISLQAGETVTCTFNNQKDANIVVIKQTDPDGDTQSFDFTASYDNDGFSLTDGQQNDSGDIDPGTYSVSETVPAGWDLTSSPCVSSKGDSETAGSISLQAGETVTCTFNNQKDANIVVIKQTDPDGDTQSFDFTASYDNDGFSLTDGQQNDSGDLDPGTYSVSETVPAGWDLTSSPCVSSKGDSETIGNISLQAGETVTCTFNNQKDAKIVVIKQTDPDGDTQSFDFTASYDNDGFSLTDNGQNNSGDLDPGTYSVSETVPTGWDLTSSPCVSSKGDSETIGNISLQAGETVTCTFYNQKDANIVVIKQTDPDGDTQSFSFTASYDGDGFSLTDGQQNDSGDLNPGTYSVSETVPDGWDLTSSPCVSSKGNSETAGSISLQAGETVTCTFNNRKRGKVEVLKITNGAANPLLDIRFTLYRDGPDADPDLTGTDVQLETLTTLGDADGLLQFAEKLVPGTTYTICENPVPAGWTSLWTIGFSVGGNIVTPYNPNANDPIPSDVGIRCIDFTVNPGQTKQFEVHNDFPGGDPRTIGYWKNWNRCSGGGQAATAAKNGGAAAGFFILEDLLPQLIGDFNVTTCAQAVNVLSKADQNGKNKSSDAAYELAAQFLAAKLNLAAGAETCSAVQTAVLSAQSLLDQINFTGSGDYLTSKDKQKAALRTQALSLATTLDRYNNGILCP